MKLDPTEVYAKLGQKITLICQSVSYPATVFEWSYRKCEVHEWDECTAELPGAWVSKDLLEFYHKLINTTTSSPQDSLTNTSTNNPIITPNTLLKPFPGTKKIRSTNTVQNSTEQVAFPQRFVSPETLLGLFCERNSLKFPHFYL